MQENRIGYTPQPIPHQGTVQFIQPTYPGFNGAPQPKKYNRKSAIVIGNIQMVIGTTCVAMNSVLIGIGDSMGVSIIAYGIWGGIMFIIAGLLQVLSGKKVPSKCLIIAAMVMCIIASCVSSVVIALGIIDAILGGQWWASCGYRHCDYGSDPYYHLILGSIMAILAFIEAVISIIGSAYCCAAVCCGSTNVSPVPVYFVAYQPFMNRGKSSAFVSPQNQNPFPSQSTLPEIAYIPQPRATMNPVLASDPPPSYSPDWMPQTKSS